MKLLGIPFKRLASSGLVTADTTDAAPADADVCLPLVDDTDLGAVKRPRLVVCTPIAVLAEEITRVVETTEAFAVISVVLT